MDRTATSSSPQQAWHRRWPSRARVVKRRPQLLHVRSRAKNSGSSVMGAVPVGGRRGPPTASLPGSSAPRAANFTVRGPVGHSTSVTGHLPCPAHDPDGLPAGRATGGTPDLPVRSAGEYLRRRARMLAGRRRAGGGPSDPATRGTERLADPDAQPFHSGPSRAPKARETMCRNQHPNGSDRGPGPTPRATVAPAPFRPGPSPNQSGRPP